MAEEENEQVAKSSGSGGTPKTLLILLIINIVVMVGVVGVLLMDKKKQDQAQSIDKIAQGAAEGHGATHESGGESAEEAVAKADLRFYGVGDFTANLSGPGAGHYVKVSVNLKLDGSLSEQEIEKRKPQIRDKVIFILNSKSPKDLQSIDGRSYLKEEILTAINGVLETGKIEAVYFQSFIFE